MVVLNRIYTRSGDDGTTALGTGERRKKYDLRICAYGPLLQRFACARLSQSIPAEISFRLFRNVHHHRF